MGFLPYNGSACDERTSMTRRNFSVVLCLLVFSLQLSSPLVACIEGCHSRTPGCHLEEKQEPGSQACPHSKAASTFAMDSKSGCDCAIQAHRPLAKETVFTLDPSRTEIPNLSPVGFDSSAKMVFNALETRLHSPPLSSGLAEQNTFLLNSNLRI